MTKRVLFVVVESVDSGHGTNPGRRAGYTCAPAEQILALWTLGALQKPDGGKVE